MVVLIVDDEHSVISSISNIIFVNFSNCFEIHSAINAEDALEIAQTTKIDLLITDIRMPGMDGIKLATLIGKIHPEMRLVFVSAYDKKEYLKAAIKLNAYAYIDKPIVSSELVDVISKLMKVDYTDVHVNDDKKTDFLKSLISGNGTKSYYDTMFKSIYNCDIADFSFDLLMIKSLLKECNVNIFSFIIKYFKDWLTNDEKVIIYKKSDDLFIILIISQKNKKVIHHFNDIYIKLSTIGGIIMAVSSSIVDCRDIQKEYISTSIAIEKGFYNPNGIKYAKDKYIEVDNCNPYKILDEYQSIIHYSAKSDIVEFLHKTYETIKKNMDMPVNVVKFLFKQFIYATYVFYSGIDSITSFDSFEEIEKMDFFSLDELYEFTVSKIIYIHESVFGNKLIAQIKSCIEKSYTDPNFSIQDICDTLHMSASHISSKFKNAMGITINNYITMVRLKRACALIKSGLHSSKEISHMVGYEDSNYFSRLFKNHFGMTVTEYRKEYEESEFN